MEAHTNRLMARRNRTFRISSLPGFLLASLLTCTTAEQAPIELWILPHSHADVGWLQTVNSLARVNVSRILDGVVATLQANPKRRFVWDEMAFLQYWWDHDATPAQRRLFLDLVQTKRIEMVDNGWSQHDMGATTLDSMMNNWMEGHEWIRTNVGSAYAPRVGWSLDPFGMSSTQAVLQAMMGMDAWFFTRLSADVVEQRKRDRSLEFVWRASSSALPVNETEIFCHVFESYYCMPHDWQFEWGAPAPNASTLVPLSHKLANLTLNRSAWFRTRHVLIPWGCDYMYQDANLTFSSTDEIIATINAHSSAWGVHAQYGTASEYLDAVKAATTVVKGAVPVARGASDTAGMAVTFPTAQRGTSFFPYQDWSGYFTSRAQLKQLSRNAHVALIPAEQLFVRRGRDLARQRAGDARDATWGALETARRNAAIFQHHDAITGTFCAASEGCPGMDQDIGSHDVLGDYRRMLVESISMSTLVFETLAPLDLAASGLWVPASTSERVSLSPTFLGEILMGQGDGGEDAALYVFNPLAHTVTEVISVPVPVCAVLLRDARTGAIVPSQTTAALEISDRAPPYYDFALSFIATLPPLGWRGFRIAPVRFARRHCVASDQLPLGSSTPTYHDAAESPPHAPSIPPKPMILENRFWRLEIDPRYGLRSAFDKESGVAHALTHTVMTYEMAPEALKGAGAAYAMNVQAPGRALLDSTAFLPGELQCRAWRATLGCDATGSRDRAHDAACSADVGGPNSSGFCECAYAVGLNEMQTVALHRVDCDRDGKRPPVACADICRAGAIVNRTALHSTLARGPVLHEARLQLTTEHSERWRLWQSDDPAIGRRIELGLSVGVLEPMTVLFSRFSLGSASQAEGEGGGRARLYSEDNDLGDLGSTRLYSEDNGYEAIPRNVALGPAPNGSQIALHTFPSQQSAFLRTNGSLQLALLLDRAQGVAHIERGSLDLMQHRRSTAFQGSIAAHTPVVLDDTDRILSSTWVILGTETRTNRLRHESKLRRLSPPVLAFSSAKCLPPPRTSASATSPPITPRGARHGAPAYELPPVLHLQSVRAVAPNASAFVLRLQHLYAEGEDAEHSVNALVDVDAVLQLVAPDAKVATATRTTLDGVNDAAFLAKRRLFPTEEQGLGGQGVVQQRALPPVAGGAGTVHVEGGKVQVVPFELPTWRVSVD